MDMKKLKKLVNVNFKKENKDPEKYLNKVKIVRVCDFIIFDIPILTVEIIYVADHTVKIEISNIIKSQILTIFTLFRYFFRIPIFLFEISNLLNDKKIKNSKGK